MYYNLEKRRMCSIVPQWPPNSLWGLYQCRTCTRGLELFYFWAYLYYSLGMYCLKKHWNPKKKQKKRFVLSSLLTFQNLSSVLPSPSLGAVHMWDTLCNVDASKGERTRERKGKKADFSHSSSSGCRIPCPNFLYHQWRHLENPVLWPQLEISNMTGTCLIQQQEFCSKA